MLRTKSAAALAQQARGQRALAAAADRQRRRLLQLAGEGRAECAGGTGQAPWRQPAPWGDGQQRRRMCSAGVQGVGQGLGLAQVAGMAVGQHPGGARES